MGVTTNDLRGLAERIDHQFGSVWSGRSSLGLPEQQSSDQPAACLPASSRAAGLNDAWASAALAASYVAE